MIIVVPEDRTVTYALTIYWPWAPSPHWSWTKSTWLSAWSQADCVLRLAAQPVPPPVPNDDLYFVFDPPPFSHEVVLRLISVTATGLPIATLDRYIIKADDLP